MSKIKIIDYINASKTYDNTRNSDNLIIEIMAKRKVFNKNDNILDFGCGTGNYLSKFSELYECNCFGIEPSRGMRQKAIEKNPKLVILGGNHNNIPFEEDFFGLIYMTDVIHHVPDIGIMFKNFYKKLKHSGYICILTESWKQIENRWYNNYFPSLANNEKNRYPDIDKIVNISMENGLKLETIDIKENSEENIIGEHFIKMVEEKNYSMFRILDNEEYKNGLKELKQNINQKVITKGAGESIIWLKK